MALHLSTEYVEGMEAAQNGKPLSDNPYDFLDTEVHTAWCYGWQKGMMNV